MKKSPLFYGGLENDEFGNYGVDGFIETLEDTPLADNVKIYDFRGNENINIKSIVQNVTADGKILQGIRQILSPIGTLKSGMYVDVPLKNQTWFITTLPDNNKIYEKAIMEYCNWILKWQDKDGNILEYPCSIENATKYNSGESGGKYIIFGSAQYLVKMPYDNNTIKLESGRRFLIDKNKDNPTAYKITQVDITSGNYENLGIIQLIVQEDQFNPNTDNKELMIADYFKVEDDTIPPPIEDVTINIETDDLIIKCGGKEKIFKPIILDSDNNILDMECEWDITLPEIIDKKYLIKNVNDNILSIKFLKETPTNLLPFSIVIKVSIKDTDISDELYMEVGALWQI